MPWTGLARLLASDGMAKKIMAKEIELKLLCPREALDRVEQHPLLQDAPLVGEPDTLENVYFDTPDLLLSAAKVAVRTRQSRAGAVQTVKCASESLGGLAVRPEWEYPFKDEFDFSGVEADAVRELLQAQKPRLTPMFSTTFLRRTRRVELRPGVSVLVMIDAGKVVAGEREEDIAEVELELVSGEPADLREFALALATDLPLLPFDLSKAERGYRLFAGEALQPVRAGFIRFGEDWPPLRAFVALAELGLQAWQADVHGALVTDNPEFVHQFRVALRRLGALMRVFEPVLPEAFFDDWTVAVKEIAATAGEMRDLDVMHMDVLEPMLKGKPGARRREMVGLAIDACQRARDRAAAALPGMTRGAPLLAFAQDLAALGQGESGRRLDRFASKQLARAHRRAVKRFDRAVRKPSAETSHALRIALKYLRYSCEFFSPLFETEAMMRYARAVSRSQDDLGAINDLHVALGRLDDWAGEDARLRVARDYIADWQSEKVEAQLAKALRRVGQLLRKSQPWSGESARQGVREARRRLRAGITLKSWSTVKVRSASS